MLKGYIDPAENEKAKKLLPKLMVEGLLLGGTGLGVLALIFEIAADAFSVAAYQTLLAIHGAEGNHEIAIYAFIVLSILLFLGIVPAYKAGAYLRPNAGGSGPLVEAIGPEKMRWLSWIGTSLFFIDAVLTIIISSISAADVVMLLAPEFAAFRIVLAEIFAFFIMAVLVAVGPKRAVPLFLIGGGAFTIFTIGALAIVGGAAAGNPEWAFLTEGIVGRLEANGVVEHVVRAQESVSTIGTVLFFQLFFRSMSSAMLGFSGYEVIPASGKHAARPKWKVINTALTLAAVFLITTGVFQLFAAQRWNIPATEGYSTLLIEYEIVAAQVLGTGVDEAALEIIPLDREAAEERYDELESQIALGLIDPEELEGVSRADFIDEFAPTLAISRALTEATNNNAGGTFLTLAGVLLAIILLLAQGGGYIGGAAVAANAARLGRLPGFFANDSNGIVVIWAIAAILIPIIREVVVVESYYAFGFVSAFIITSTTVFFARDDALTDRGIKPGSSEAKSLRFAGLRGMIASYIMGVVLITQKTDALLAIVIFGALLTVYQLWTANGQLKTPERVPTLNNLEAGTSKPTYEIGIQRAHDQARQRGILDALEEIIHDGSLNKFNVGPARVRRLVSYLYNIDPELMEHASDEDHHERIEEPNIALETTYKDAYDQKALILRRIEEYSHLGIFMFINNYHLNWVSTDHGRDASIVQRAMLDILFPLTEHDVIWKEFCAFKPHQVPEPIWQFSRQRYLWAKDQWPNLSDRITTIWTLQDFGLIPQDINIQMVISVADGRQFRAVNLPTTADEGDRTSEVVAGDGDGDAPESMGIEQPFVDEDE